MSAFLLGAGFKADMGTQSRKLVLLKLIDACDDDGTRIFPAMATVARAAQCSTRQVQREIKSFLAIGLLRLVKAGGSGPKSTNEYSLDLDVLFSIAREGWEAYAASVGARIEPETPENKGDMVSPLDEKGDIGDGIRVTPETPKGDNGSHTTPPYPSNNPSEERAREREVLEDEPKQLRLRFNAMMVGRHNNPWPKVLVGSPDWAYQQFVKLSPEERVRAEERRDAYLAACPKLHTGPNKGMANAAPLGIYLRDKMFDLVDAVAPKVVQQQERVRCKADVVSVAPYGPIWGGKRMLALLFGPVHVELPDDLRQTVINVFEVHKRTSHSRAIAYANGRGIDVDEAGNLIFPDSFERDELARRIFEAGYPEVHRLDKAASQRERLTAEGRFGALADLCEAVPVGSEIYERWREYHDAMNWPFVPDPGAMRVVYFPKGGPDGLLAFERAVNETMGMERGNDDAVQEK
ncbi:MAG: helix-turn-helix domain-containing protein [Rhizobium sp.]|nr:MAG: helix-turn-helix domain-containing protein [Rhizobium sp.]